MAVRHVVLVGLMGSGKTTVGAALAARLGWPLRDSDADLQAATGRSARELAAAEGIDRLHDREAAHMLEAIADTASSVIGSAAAVIDDPAIRCRLSDDPALLVAWLRIDPGTARSRMAGGDHHPRVEDLAAQASRRDPWFRATADVEIDADMTPLMTPRPRSSRRSGPRTTPISPARPSGRSGPGNGPSG